MARAAATGRARTVLVTGCSSGIGRCVAEGLRARGYRVFPSARRGADVVALRDDGFADALQLDLDDGASIAGAVERLLARTGGRLDALFNNGAYGQPGAVEDLTRDALRRQFETNLFGWVELSNAVLPAMRRQGHGRLIMNSSVLGLVAMPMRGAYNASKFALEGLSDTLRMELAGSGIHVSLIEPGPISSRFRENALAAFARHVDAASSVHRQAYARMLAARFGEARPAPFTLPPTAVLAKVIAALESKRPRARYPVTVPSHLFLQLRRVLPTRWLDGLLARAGR